jgi:hypothetical protein
MVIMQMKHDDDRSIPSIPALKRSFRIYSMKSSPVLLKIPFVFLALIILAAGVSPVAAQAPQYSLTKIASGETWYPSAGLTAQDSPVVSYYNPATGEVRVVQKDPESGKYTDERVAGTTYTRSTSLALDRHGEPRISYGTGLSFFNIEYGSMMYAARKNGNWAVETVDKGKGFLGSLDGDAGQSSTLILTPDEEENPVICYSFRTKKIKDIHYEPDTGTLIPDLELGDGFACSMKKNGAWSRNIQPLMNVFAPSQVIHTDRSGQTALHVAFYNANKQRIELTGQDLGDGNVQWAVPRLKLAADRKGREYIAYIDGFTLKYMDTSLKYMPAVKTIDPDAWVTGKISFIIDTKDRAHIVYYDFWHKTLKHARIDTSGNVTITNVRAGLEDYRGASVVTDSGDRPQIYFYDSTNAGLYMATERGTPRG